MLRRLRETIAAEVSSEINAAVADLLSELAPEMQTAMASELEKTMQSQLQSPHGLDAGGALEAMAMDDALVEEAVVL